MPFDPFFSSANKNHFVWSENYERIVKPEVARIIGLPIPERKKIHAELHRKGSMKTLTLTESHVLHRLDFIWAKKNDALRRRAQWVLRKRQKKGGPTFHGGFNTHGR